MNRQPFWEPTDADLVAFLLEDLEGARAEYVAAHLEQCRECSERLAQIRQVIGRLEALPQPDGDDPQRRTMLKARIQLEAASIAEESGIWLKRARIGTAIAAALTVIILLGPVLTDAGSAGIRQLVGVDPGFQHSPGQPRDVPDSIPRLPSDPSEHAARPTIGRTELPYAPIAPADLPGSNNLVDATAFSDGSFEATYEGSDGLRLFLRQEPATTDGVRFSTDLEYQELQIGDVRATITFDDALNSVDQIYWVRGGTFFSLRAPRLTRGDFPLEEAIQVVERIIELQDDPEASVE